MFRVTRLKRTLWARFLGFPGNFRALAYGFWVQTGFRAVLGLGLDFGFEVLGLSFRGACGGV